MPDQLKLGLLYIAPVNQLIETITTQQLTVRDALQVGAQFVVQWKMQDKLLSGLGSICSTAKEKALAFAQKNPLATPYEYATTPEGMLLKAINHNDTVKNTPPSDTISVSNQISTSVNQSCEAILKDGYYEVNGFKFTKYYYNKLWTSGRPAPSLVAAEILREAKIILPDSRPEFMRYETDNWEMIFNPVTKEVHHLKPINKK